MTEFVEGASADSLRVVEERWRQIAGVDDPGIAFVGVTHDGKAAAHSICTSLGANTSRAGATYVAAGAPDGADDTATIDTMAADVVVLIAARGDRVRAIRDVNGSLHKLGVEARWVLLTDRA